MIRFWLYIFALNSSLVPSSVKRPVRGARATSLQLSRPAHASCLMQFRRSYVWRAGWPVTRYLFGWLEIWCQFWNSAIFYLKTRINLRFILSSHCHVCCFLVVALSYPDFRTQNCTFWLARAMSMLRLWRLNRLSWIYYCLRKLKLSRLCRQR